MSQAEAKSSALERLLEVISDTLEMDVQDGAVSFLGLGGDSLAAIIVAETLREEGLIVEIGDLFSDVPLERVAAALQAS
ncbi:MULTISPECIES: phosphopantetheine-binding protein [Streptomyces]|uniref:Phosphopantetheine-binding protein n=1 Tax=Streptomyces lonegramiae TaxID=3075524 RepID=A0ABU2XDG8_9ACTN|nr:phosphopantetheine-binding protein [Streptomyces sp. DSM 41529]MDT0543951.1 phosphopantetheine-binding protein [Streptomyces sp. DSM 41529]